MKPSRRNGFALLIVIWGLGVIALLIVSFLSTSRLRLQDAFNTSAAARADLIASGVVDMTVLTLVRERLDLASGLPPAGAPHDGTPRFCTLDNEIVAISIEDENGKIDINAASEALLQKVFIAILSMPPERARQLSEKITDFRTSLQVGQPMPSRSDDLPFPPKYSAFQTVMEIDQVASMDKDTAQSLLPFITVHSRANGINPRVAPAALFAALAGYSHAQVASLAATPYPNHLNRDDPRFPAAYRQVTASGAFLIHAEVILADNLIMAREAIIEVQPASGGLYAIREIRRGEPLFSRSLERLRRSGDLARC